MMLFYNNTWERLALLCFLFAAHLHVGATNYTLTANDFASIQWSDPTVWAPNGVPGAGDDVTINGTGNTALITDGDITVKSFTVNGLSYIFGPGTLTVTELLDTRYPMSWQMGLVIAEGANGSMTDVNFSNSYTSISFNTDLVVNGNLVLEARAFSGRKLIINGTLTQKEGNLNASIYVNPGGVLNINSPNAVVEVGRIQNKGTLNWQNGEIRSVAGPIINTGLWNINVVNETLAFYGFFQDSVIFNSGTIQIASNAANITLKKKIVNTGTINMNGPTTLSLLAAEHYGTINGPAGSSLVLSGNYSGITNTIYGGSVIHVPSFKTEYSTSLVIQNGADISTIQDFFFNQGPLELGLALPSTANYEISASVQTNVNQNFTGTFLLQGGSFDGTCLISFNTPNLTANSGYFGGYVQVTLSAGTILNVKSLGVTNMVNDGIINCQQNSAIGTTPPGITNNGVWNMNGDSVLYYSYVDLEPLVCLTNNGTMNFNNFYAQFSTIMQNNGTINIGNNHTVQITGELRQYGTIAGQSGSKLRLLSNYAPHTFHSGAQTSGLSVLETNYGKTTFKQGTVLNNIDQFIVDNSTLETSVILPPASQYWFKKSEIRLNTIFEPTTVLDLEDTNIEGSGNIRIGNAMNWNGGTMDVPVRIYENAQVYIEENEARPIISAPFTNEGNITLSGGIIEINTGFFKNGGSWNVDSDEDVIMDGYTSFTNDGIFSICGNQPIKIAFNVPFINTSSGTFKGQGSYTFNAGFTNEGTVAPGCSPGILTIEDNLIAPAVVEIEVAGGNISQYDQLLVNGNMTAGGLLRVVVPQGSSLNGSIKVIQTTGTFTGTFAQVDMPPNFTLQYLPDGLLLTSDGTVSANDLLQPESVLSVAPTLASTHLVITAHQPVSDDALLQVYNLNGQLVRSISWNRGAAQQELPVADLANGFYTLRLTAFPNWNKKVVVNH